MNVISYVNGDAKITDYPECSARPLARMVQVVNDNLAAEDGFLSPENSLLALDLAWKTVGTADVSDRLGLEWAKCVFGVAPRGWETAYYAAHRWAMLTSEELSTEQLVGFVDHAIDVWRDLAGPAIAGEHTQKAARGAAKLAVERGFVAASPGARGAKLHRISNPCDECGMPVAVGQGSRHESCIPKAKQ